MLLFISRLFRISLKCGVFLQKKRGLSEDLNLSFRLQKCLADSLDVLFSASFLSIYLLTSVCF